LSTVAKILCTLPGAPASSLSLSAPTSATAGAQLSVTVTAYDAYGNVVTGYTGTVSFGSSDREASLPPSYTFTPADQGSRTFLITLGTAGPQNVTVTAGSAGQTITSNVAALSVSPASSLELTWATLPPATVHNSYTAGLAAVGGYGSYTFKLAPGSSLPTGLKLMGAGILIGTPTKAGTWSFTLIATDRTNHRLTGRAKYTLSVNRPLAIGPTTLGVATVGNTINELLSASGGSGSGYTFQLAEGGDLPVGPTVSSTGLLEGNPTRPGRYRLTVVVTDSNGASGSRNYTLMVHS
jgi:hypothetical protein